MLRTLFLAICLLCKAVMADPATLVLASKSFTEQHILAEITRQYLDSKGFKVQSKTDMATVIIRDAMLNGQVDLAWEYTGTSLIIFNKITKHLSLEETYQTVKKLDGKKGLIWLNPAKMNDTYAFAMQRKRAESENIHTISQMVAQINRIRKTDPKHNWQLGLDMEFAGRSDGLKPFQKAYHLQLDRPQVHQMYPGLVYNAIRDGFVDAGLVYATDGRIKGFDLLVLNDDQQFFPSYAATPVVRSDTLKANPGLAQALNTISALLNNETMTELNAQVDMEHQTPQEVAKAFLIQHNLL